jgi:hypothetical protein
MTNKPIRDTFALMHHLRYLRSANCRSFRMSEKFSGVSGHFGFYRMFTCLRACAESLEVSGVSGGELSGVSEEIFGVCGT